VKLSSLFLALFATAALAVPGVATAAGFGFQPGSQGFEVSVDGEGGATSYAKAGGHPYSLVTSVNFNLQAGSEAQPGGPFTEGDLRDIELELPPGLIENPSAVARCSQASFQAPRNSPFEASRSGESCPPLSQIGSVQIRSGAEGGSSVRTFGVFNLTPPPGFPSQIGFSPFGVPIVLTPYVRELGGEYGITLKLANFSQRIDLRGLTLTIWGTPWAISHNGQRGNCLNEAEPAFPWAKCAISPPTPEHAPFAYLTMPTTCSAPLRFAASADSWQSSTPVSATDSGPLLESCATVPFEPQVLAQTTDQRATAPTGFNFSLTAKEENLVLPSRTAPSQVRRVVVALPEGITLNPSLAAGLGSCSPAQYGAETASSPPGAGCPNDSRIGDFTVRSPLFEEPIEGGIFLAEPDDLSTPTPGAENPFDSLLALYLIAKAPERGVLVKVAGRLDADPASGRLTATFDRLPQLPYSNLELHLREGQRAPLLEPPACGSYATSIDLSPWLDPDATTHLSSPLPIARGTGADGACPSGATPPFRPTAEGGTLNKNAGSYSPFHLLLSRQDSEQEITSYSATLPPGLLGKVAGIPYCPDAAIEAAKLRTGREEEEHPSCPVASEIGNTVSGYGASSALAYAPGKLYLAGPYHGSGFSIVAIDSATVGPFDLGVVVIRSAIEVNRHNAQVSVDSAGSDPIPHILQGVPIHLRDVRVYIDRPGFILNPSSCEPFSAVSTLTGSGARFSDSSDDVPVTISNPFQVIGCSGLGFKPSLALSLRGGTKRGNYPALRAVYRGRGGDANIGTATVTLPHSLFLAQEHIETVCTRPQTEREACPARSIYGRAKVFTPLLAEPLEGPVFLRASPNLLPDLGAVLRGDGIAIELDARIDSDHGGIRATFEGLPDAPVEAFVLTLRGGKRGLLVNAEDTCGGTQRAKVRFLGQSNLGEAFQTPLHPQCSGTKRRRHGHKAGRGKRRASAGRRS